MPSPSPAPTLSVRLVRPFIRALLAQGVDTLPVVEGLDVSPHVFGDPEARLPRDVVMQLLDRALYVSGDAALGVHAAEHVHPGDFDALELVARASGSRRGALAAVRRYVGLMIDDVSLDHSVEAPMEAWTLVLPPPRSPVSVEFAIGVLVVVGRSLSEGNENPDLVELASPEPSAAHRRECERVYGCPVRWGAARDAMLVATTRLDRKLAHVTPSLAAALEQHAARLLADLPRAAAQSTRVREHIVDALRAGPVTPEEICRRMKVSKRTLRRRLQDEGKTFSDLLSEVRQEQARQHLADPNVSITEAAFLLGFADTRAFQRAFRKWFGVSPSEFRRAQTGGRGAEPPAS